DVSRQQYAVPRVLDHQHTGAVIGIVGNLPEGGTSRQEMKLDLLPLPGSIGVTVMHRRPQQGLGLTRLTSNNFPDPQVFNKALHASGMIFVVMAYHQLVDISHALLTQIRYDYGPTCLEFIAVGRASVIDQAVRSEEHTSELQSRENLVCRL